MPRSPPMDRPSWRLTPGKALSYRFEAPTFCPGVCRWGARVSASPPAKPYATVPRRQPFAPDPAGRPPELAPHSRQSLELPFRGANFLPRSPPVGRPSWRLTSGKALCHRSEAPTLCPGACRPVRRPSWRLTPGKALCHRSEAPTFLPQSLTRNPSRRLADWEAKKDRCTNKVHYAMMLIQPERRLV